ncbi:hypothetical protein L6164_007657 [Bauhinia variegata]|uniref:Uncharacterized protein n=1 Tax=Bauhinia variegata TaxID=167791 RepID=A0ACB9PFP7_BAUVA|nr:hypothetical protein L6164_007657 [Bauhinia variegata]
MPMVPIRGPIQGMETVVATVSGYHGTERSNLIKLITHAGGNYVGRMSKSITHLICWKFEGKKFDLAHKFNTIIVNHQWVEDCIKQRRRLPENSYVLLSGEEVGPLVLEVPLFVQTSSLTRENLPSERADDLGSLNQNSEFTSGDSGNPVWADSSIINKKNKLKLVEKDVKHSKKTNKRCFDDISLSRILNVELKELSSHSFREARKGKRKISDSDEVATLAECSRRGRRLVKNNVHEDVLDPLISDSNHEEKHSRSRPHTDPVAPSCLSGGVTNDNIQENREGSGDESTNQSGMINAASDGTEQIKDSNNLSTSRNLILCMEDPLPTTEQTPADVGSDADNDQVDQVAGPTTSTELSCVICWTEFSSTRGILRCGHRFCYSCIQTWADQLLSRRKLLTCPLCKMSFAHIIKVDDAASTDQKVYSQTIPCEIPTSDVFILADRESPNYGSEIAACVVCRGREPEDLLVSCNVCQIRRIHTYCLDPPLFPWACTHCKDLRMLFHNH